jgi:hypothetical protein
MKREEQYRMGGRGRGHGFGRGGGRRHMRGGWQDAELPSVEDAPAWFSGRLPDDWFVGTPELSIDRDEILVLGSLPPVASGEGAEPASDADRAAAELGRIQRFREQTREERMQIADEAELRYSRKVAWGVQVGETREIFTNLSIPVMTRLRQPERHILDTLVDAGVARSRSDALAWCVRLVGKHAEDWLAELRTAMEQVDRLRKQGPEV